MLSETFFLKSIMGSAMIVGFMFIRLFSVLYTTGIFSNICSFFWRISHFRHTSDWNQCTWLARKVAEYTAKWILETGDGIYKISFLQKRRLYKSYVHPTRLTWLIFQAISMPGRCISQLVIFKKIPAGHVNSARGFSLGGFHASQKVRKIHMRHAIPRLEQCYPYSGLLTSLVLAWNGIVQMDSRDNVILYWRPGSGIIRNKSWLLKSHMGHTRCV
jgi:hypothetical protein